MSGPEPADDPRPRAALLSIGDELVQGRHVDRNAATLSAWLTARGVRVVRHLTVDDDEAGLTDALADLGRESDLVVSTGGLGPTLDDTTRAASARAAGLPLVRDAAAEDALEQRFREMGREMAASNLRQVDVPRGAVVLPNAHGTAPGFLVDLGKGRGHHAALPGPPREMQPMLAQLEPHLAARGLLGEPLPTRSFHLFLKSESVFAEEVRAAGDWMDRDADPLMSVTAGGGILSVQLRARSADPASRARLDERAAAFADRYGDAIYATEDERPAFALGRLLLERGLTVALAESCTGGGIAAELTDVPGISAALRYAWVTYADEAKTRELGVPAALLADHGAVSGPVVRAMAAGAAERAGADLALAVSGVAGPGGGTAEKPVGTVWFGLHVLGETTAFERRFPPLERASVRRWARVAGLLGLRKALLERDPG